MEVVSPQTPLSMMEVVSPLERRPPEVAFLPEVQEQRLVIAIDYGTTYTGVAFATPRGTNAYLGEIEIIQDWGPGMGNHDKIPSVISYSLRPNREQQWGADLSPQAVAMVHTKLQLDVDDAAAELDLILQMLDGINNLSYRYIEDSAGKPKYPRKGPEEIVTDYLTKVFEYLLKAVEAFSEELRSRIPVDIVATIPAEWGYRAKNSTFRALTKAGFNKKTFPELRKLLLVSEPEAAAIYTARYLRDQSGAYFLKKGEYFVLCDAGGGTVDVVAYRVKQLKPTFEIELVEKPNGYKCGSIFINLAFKKWLKNLLGERRYQELDQGQMHYKITSHDAEAERMRDLMSKFDVHKRKFRRGYRDIKIDLPEPFENLNLDDRVSGGQITITYKDMQSFFDPRVERIVQLIQSQVELVENLRRRVKSVFLVGGFAASQYLQESIQESLEMRDLELRLCDNSWTAVVRGAAIFGIEKSNNITLISMGACARSFGVSVNSLYSDITHNSKDLVVDPLTKNTMAKEQLVWLIKKGDLILSNEPKIVKTTFNKNFTEQDTRTGSFQIFAFDGDDLPDRLANAQNELSIFREIEYDFDFVPLQQFSLRRPSANSLPYYVAQFTLTLILTLDLLQLRLHLNGREEPIYTADITENLTAPELEED